VTSKKLTGVRKVLEISSLWRFQAALRVPRPIRIEFIDNVQAATQLSRMQQTQRKNKRVIQHTETETEKRLQHLWGEMASMENEGDMHLKAGSVNDDATNM